MSANASRCSARICCGDYSVPQVTTRRQVHHHLLIVKCTVQDKVINRSYLNPKRKTHSFCETCIQLPYASKYALRSLVHGPSNQN
jgi:hypothetical protein